jgi:two-component system sensor histidine kinase ChvG
LSGPDAEAGAAAKALRDAADDNAHAFKGQLATILASLEPLRRIVPEDNERAKRALALIDAALGRLTALIDAARRLDHVAAELLAAPRTRIDLSRVVEAVLTKYRQAMTERGIVLRGQVGAGLFVEAGPGTLDAAMEAILDNAVRVSPEGKAITVNLRRAATGAELVIEDEGPGIDPTALDGFFERFAALNAPRREGQGKPTRIGIGLCAAQRYVQAAGGSIAAANRPSGGLALRIVLPLSGR